MNRMALSPPMLALSSSAMGSNPREARRCHASGARLDAILAERVMVLDGAMGTQLQSHRLTEAQYRGREFPDWPHELGRCQDVLTLTQPELVQNVHRDYFRAGADIVETNTLNANKISMSDYGLQDLVSRLNTEAVRLARTAAAEAEASDGRVRFVAGVIGPTCRAASIPVSAEAPDARAVTFDDLVRAYTVQAAALLDAGCDLLLVETVFDTINCKGALYAINTLFEERTDPYARVPVIVSATVTESSCRTVFGQTLADFYASIRHGNLFAVGINCAFGPAPMESAVVQMSSLSDCWTSCYPNAGLPNAGGTYDMAPEEMASRMFHYAEKGWVNIVGGCCGTTPEHIKAIADAVRDVKPRPRGTQQPHDAAAGGEILVRESLRNAVLVEIGKQDVDFRATVNDVRRAVEGGSTLIGLRLEGDDGDAAACVQAATRLMNTLAADPVASRVAWLLEAPGDDGCDILEAALKCVQGPAFVVVPASLAVQLGDAAFAVHAARLRRYGAYIVLTAAAKVGQESDAGDLLQRALQPLVGRDSGAGFVESSDIALQ